jgi:membrane protein implicated in regulation of membrane protease activity
MEQVMFKTNEGGLDRTLRIVAGLVLIALVFAGPKTQLGWIGLVPLVTGLIGWCPVYSLFGMSTCPMKKG